MDGCNNNHHHHFDIEFFGFAINFLFSPPIFFSLLPSDSSSVQDLTIIIPSFPCGEKSANLTAKRSAVNRVGNLLTGSIKYRRSVTPQLITNYIVIRPKPIKEFLLRRDDLPRFRRLAAVTAKSEDETSEDGYV